MGLGCSPAEPPVLRIRGDEVLLPIPDHLTSACQEVQDPAAQRSV